MKTIKNILNYFKLNINTPVITIEGLKNALSCTDVFNIEYIDT